MQGENNIDNLIIRQIYIEMYKEENQEVNWAKKGNISVCNLQIDRCDVKMAMFVLSGHFDDFLSKHS